MSNDFLKRVRTAAGLPPEPPTNDGAPFASWANSKEGDFILGRVTKTFESTYGTALTIAVEKSNMTIEKAVALGLNYSTLKDVDAEAVVGKRILVAFYGMGNSKENNKPYRIIRLDVLPDAQLNPEPKSVTEQVSNENHAAEQEAKKAKCTVEEEFEKLFSETAKP